MPDDARVDAIEEIALVVHDITSECSTAMVKFPKFNSAHEGFAVILEEVDELWNEVRRKDRDPVALRKEAVQVGAMALRFLIDICGEEEGNA